MALDLLVDVLAVHRITRLVTADVVTRPWRARIIRRSYRGTKTDYQDLVSRASDAEADAFPHGDDNAPALATLVTCPWCVSVYVSAGVVIARRFAPGLWNAAAYGLALSTASTLVANRETPR